MRFKARELREGIPQDELRRELNAIQKEIRTDLEALERKSKVSQLLIDGSYAASYGEILRVAPPTSGFRLILPPRNLEQPDTRVVVVVEASAGALSAEAVDATINGAATLTLLAGIGTLEFRLTPTGWYAFSATLFTVALTSLAAQASDTFVGNVAAGSAVPTAVALSTLAGAGLAFGSHTLDVTGSTSITITSDQVQRAALTGDVTAGANSNATTIAANAVTNAKAAQMAAATIKLRALGAGTGDPIDGTGAQAGAILQPETFTWTAAHTFGHQLLLGTEQTDAGTGAVNVTLGNVIRLRFTSAAGNITLGTVSGCAEGRLLVVEFSGTGTHTVTHDSATANALSCPGDVNLVMAGRSGFIAVGRGATANWKILATTN